MNEIDTSPVVRRTGPPAGAAQKGGATAAAVHREMCRQHDAVIAPIVLELRRQGMSLRQIAAELTARGLKTRQEWPHWHARQVARILARALALSLQSSGAPGDVQITLHTERE